MTNQGRRPDLAFAFVFPAVDSLFGSAEGLALASTWLKAVAFGFFFFSFPSK